jgi:hypothetical protein
MPLTRPVGWLSIPRGLAVAAIGLGYLTSVVSAVDKDKALYMGGTLKGFAAPPATNVGERIGSILFPGSSDLMPKVEGRINLTSETQFAFEAGRWGLLAIPDNTITSLEYGLETGHLAPKGKALLLVIRWDPTDQFTKNAHNLLTIVYQDQSGTEQAVVMELSKDLVRPTLEALERRTGKPVAFLNVEACMLFNNAETCGYGKPIELKGLKRVFVDAGLPENRQLIVAEIEKGTTGLEMLESVEGAEIILKYHGAYSVDPACPCEGGRGEVSVVQSTRQRVVLIFTGMKKGIWGKKPAIGFASPFVEAFMKANIG